MRKKQKLIFCFLKKSLNPLFIRSQFQIPFVTKIVFRAPSQTTSQSLIHQVSVSDADRMTYHSYETWASLNPLFIRSQFQIKIFSQRHCSDFNSVSIPYSSGLSFRLLFFRILPIKKSTSQSLIHQVSVSDT